MSKGHGNSPQAPPPKNKKLATNAAWVRAQWKEPSQAPAPKNKSLKSDAAWVRAQWKAPHPAPEISTRK